MKRHFNYYDTVPKSTLENTGRKITSADIKKIEQISIDEFCDYFGVPADEKNKFNYSIERHSLLDVPNSVVLVNFIEHPFEGTELEGLGGKAHLIYPSVDDLDISPLPVIYLMPNCYENTLEHEEIHICQYNFIYPLTDEQFKIMMTMDMDHGIRYLLKKYDRDHAIDFVINAVCYKTWIELEANFHTKPPKHSWFNKAYLSSQAFMTFNAMAEYPSLNWDHEIARSKFEPFCELMVDEVPWLKEYITERKENIHDLLYEAHDELESDRMFGLIEDFE